MYVQEHCHLLEMWSRVDRLASVPSCCKERPDWCVIASLAILETRIKELSTRKDALSDEKARSGLRKEVVRTQYIYEDDYQDHFHNGCFDRFISGYGRSDSMQEDLGEPSVETIPTFSKACVPLTHAEDFPDDQVEEKRSEYLRVLSANSGAFCKNQRAPYEQYKHIKKYTDDHPEVLAPKNWDPRLIPLSTQLLRSQTPSLNVTQTELQSGNVPPQSHSGTQEPQSPPKQPKQDPPTKRQRSGSPDVVDGVPLAKLPKAADPPQTLPSLVSLSLEPPGHSQSDMAGEFLLTSLGFAEHPFMQADPTALPAFSQIPVSTLRTLISELQPIKAQIHSWRDNMFEQKTGQKQSQMLQERNGKIPALKKKLAEMNTVFSASDQVHPEFTLYRLVCLCIEVGSAEAAFRSFEEELDALLAAQPELSTGSKEALAKADAR
ncbi:hypothetical protein LTR09_009028 [Extremus antarcticus]|uniref:Uncharacterized protein n=1 Tax=Extremus antarcticus TaxID=702011 RepID=A0AAJ0D9P5_9PEZI|nr:hypothetical protein LTR09_009028 [Extremus antarcticus]